MDERLLRRYRNGDPRAGTALKNHLRALASRVLSSPGWKLTGTQRRELEVEAAKQGLQSSARSMLQFAADGLAVASELALVELRRSDGVAHGHPEASLVVAVAMETASPAQVAQLEAHGEACKVCPRHVEVVKQALKVAASSSVVEPPSHGPEPHFSDEDTEELPEGLQDAPARPRKPTAMDLRRPRSARAGREEDAPSLVSMAGPFLLLLALVLAYGWFQATNSGVRDRPWVALVPDELPPTEQAWRVEGAARQGVDALAAGNCTEAAHRLALDAKRRPDELWVRYYEGLAWVCLRDGPRARAALEAVQYMNGAKPYGLAWWLAVAQLLDDRPEEALASLDELAGKQHARAADAAKLANQLRPMLAR